MGLDGQRDREFLYLFCPSRQFAGHGVLQFVPGIGPPANRGFDKGGSTRGAFVADFRCRAQPFEICRRAAARTSQTEDLHHRGEGQAKVADTFPDLGARGLSEQLRFCVPAGAEAQFRCLVANAGDMLQALAPRKRLHSIQAETKVERPRLCTSQPASSRRGDERSSGNLHAPLPAHPLILEIQTELNDPGSRWSAIVVTNVNPWRATHNTPSMGCCPPVSYNAKTRSSPRGLSG